VKITLREITSNNWETCIKLSVGLQQKGFIASNLYSLAESKFEPAWTPLAVYCDETMVGFTMVGPDARDNSYWVVRLMVDAAFQNRGYGRAAMQRIIWRLATRPDCRGIKISLAPENKTAEMLYRSMGFEQTGLIEDGEVVLQLPL
jgi:diamine N-acetyltransferase